MQLIASQAADYAQIGAGGHWRGFVVPQGGLEPPAVLAILQRWSQRLNEVQGWGTWIAVSGGEVVGSIAIKDPAEGRIVEIGYGTAPMRRGQGHATAAVLSVLPILAAQGVVRVRAETAVSNPGSGRVLQKAGFVATQTRVDAEDGDLILWVRDLG